MLMSLQLQSLRVFPEYCRQYSSEIFSILIFLLPFTCPHPPQHLNSKPSLPQTHSWTPPKLLCLFFASSVFLGTFYPQLLILPVSARPLIHHHKTRRACLMWQDIPQKGRKRYSLLQRTKGKERHTNTLSSQINT